MYQSVTLTSREDQVVIRTPFGAVVVSAQVVGNAQHVYFTPPENFTGKLGSGATWIFERPLAS